MGRRKQPDAKCLVWYCDAFGETIKGYCRRHYFQLRRTGNPVGYNRDARLLLAIIENMRSSTKDNAY